MCTRASDPHGVRIEGEEENKHDLKLLFEIQHKRIDGRKKRKDKGQTKYEH